MTQIFITDKTGKILVSERFDTDQARAFGIMGEFTVAILPDDTSCPLPMVRIVS